MRLPIKALKQLAIKYGLSHVIVYAYDTTNKMAYVVTYGRLVQDSDQAAQFGDRLKDALQWPESLHAVSSRIKSLQERLHDAENKLFEFVKAEMLYPRAMKLMRKRKGFIVIADDEPYFHRAYDLIRTNEKKKGTWTDEDERIFTEWIPKVPQD